MEEKCYGPVILLDALGVSSFDTVQCQDFLKKMAWLEHHIPRSIQTCLEQIGIGDSFKKMLDTDQLQLRQMGDAMLLTMNTGVIDEPELLLLPAATFAALVFVLGLQTELALRGVVCVGEYFQSEHITIGPAIADAATWYETGEIIGVHLTPKACLMAEQIRIRESGIGLDTQVDRWMSDVLFSTEVPLKGHGSPGFLVNWTMAFGAYQSIQGVTAEQWFLRQLQKMPVPRGTESKYQNTIRINREMESALADSRTRPSKGRT